MPLPSPSPGGVGREQPGVWKGGLLSLRGGRPGRGGVGREGQLCGAPMFPSCCGDWGIICRVAATPSGAPWDLFSFNRQTTLMWALLAKTYFGKCKIANEIK